MSSLANADSLHDPARLQALRLLHLPGTRGVRTFDRLARLAARMLEVEIGLVSLIEADRQIFFGSHGLPESVTSYPIIPPSRSYCRFVIESGRHFAVEDARAHPELSEDEELHEVGAVAYLGVPLTNRDGLVLGTFSVVSASPRRWSEDDVELLSTLAASVWTELELRQELAERRIAEEGLREAEARLIRIREDVTDGFFAVDFEWRFTYVNAAVERLLDRPRTEILGETLWSCFPELAGSHVQGEYERVVREGVASVFETYHEPADMWVLIHAYPSDHGLSVYFHDISARKKAELRTATAESHYRRLVSTMPQSVYVVDPAGVFTEVNAALERMLGRDATDLLGSHFGSVIVEDSRPLVEGVFRNLMSGRLETSEFETWVQTRDGDRLLLAVSATAIREGESITGVHGVARDITDQREREALRLMLADALDVLGEGICLLTTEGEFVYSNRTYGEVFGISTDRPLPRRIFDLAPDEDARQFQRECLQTAVTEGRWSGRVWRTHLGTGRQIPVDITLGRVRAEDGNVMLFGIAREASDQIQREQQLRWMERLASIGTLVGGVAHELNNPLNAVLNFAQLLAMDEPDPERREDLVTIQREAERMGKVVADLKQIARTAREERSELTAVDLNEVITHVLKVQHYRLRTSNIHVELDLAGALPPILADRAQMEQVLLNLVVNAEQAMAAQYGEGNLVVRTRHTGRAVALHVIDDGPGIAPSILPRIFDPFFTTKSAGDSTGLGLSMVHSIVAQHGGEVRVDSEVAAGTAFRIDLPAAPRAEARPPTAGASGAHRSLRILVVDDEPSIRRVISRHLSRRGHLVEEAAEGGAALERVAATEYDVILSDLRMPGMGGDEFLVRLRDQGRDTRVVFMTGDASGAGMQAEQEGVQVLLKPVKLEDLTRVVEAEGTQG